MCCFNKVGWNDRRCYKTLVLVCWFDRVCHIDRTQSLLMSRWILIQDKAAVVVEILEGWNSFKSKAITWVQYDDKQWRKLKPNYWYHCVVSSILPFCFLPNVWTSTPRDEEIIIINYHNLTHTCSVSCLRNRLPNSVSADNTQTLFDCSLSVVINDFSLSVSSRIKRIKVSNLAINDTCWSLFVTAFLRAIAD